MYYDKKYWNLVLFAYSWNCIIREEFLDLYKNTITKIPKIFFKKIIWRRKKQKESSNNFYKKFYNKKFYFIKSDEFYKIFIRRRRRRISRKFLIHTGKNILMTKPLDRIYQLNRYAETKAVIIKIKKKKEKLKKKTIKKVVKKVVKKNVKKKNFNFVRLNKSKV